MTLSLPLAAAAAPRGGAAAPPSQAAVDEEVPVDDLWKAERFKSSEVSADRELSDLYRRVAKGDLPNVQFPVDSDRIDPRSYRLLRVVADFMLKNPSVKLHVDAHTCRMGSEAHNLRLSRRRAEAVKNYLVKQGVPPPSMRSRGWGSSKPLADNATEKGRDRNRRVELRFLKRDWNAVF